MILLGLSCNGLIDCERLSFRDVDETHLACITAKRNSKDCGVTNGACKRRALGQKSFYVQLHSRFGVIR
jgi:hypothetical protein